MRNEVERAEKAEQENAKAEQENAALRERVEKLMRRAFASGPLYASEIEALLSPEPAPEKEGAK